MDVEPPEGLLRPLFVPWRVLTGPGPSNVPARVQAACCLPPMGNGSLHPYLGTVYDDVIEGIKYLFQTKNTITLAICGPAHAAAETAACSLVERGDVVLVASNGLWGEQWTDLADRHEAVVKTIKKARGQVFSDAEIEQALVEHKPSLMYMTMGESTGGTLQPMEGIGHLCRKYGCILVVDVVATAGGVPVYMDRWGVDVMYTGGQKVLNALVGCSPISFSPAAWEKVLSRKTRIRSYFFDITLLANMWGCDDKPRKFHHTPLYTNLYAMRESLAMLAEEGLENSWRRHKECSEALYRGIEKLGLQFFVKDPSTRLATITTLEIPEDISGDEYVNIAKYMVNNLHVELGISLVAGERIWRIGILGQNANLTMINLVLKALGDTLAMTRAGKLGPLDIHT